MSGLSLKSWVIKLVHGALKKQNTYSTDEKIVGYWIDGKPIYRKVVEFTFPSSADELGWIDVGIPDLDHIVHLYGYADGTNPIPCYYDDTYSLYMNIAKHNGVWVIRTKTRGWLSSPAIAVIEYTKTTDAATS